VPGEVLRTKDNTAATEGNGIFDSVLLSPQSSKAVMTYFHTDQHCFSSHSPCANFLISV